MIKDTNTDSDIYRAGAKATLAWIGVIPIIFLYIMPILVGGLVDYLGLSAKQAGQIISSQLFGMLLATIGATVSVHRWNLQRAAISGLSLLLVAEVVSGFIQITSLLTAFRFLAGIGGGITQSAVTAAISAKRRPDQIFAFILFGAPAISALAMVGLPYFLPVYGIRGVFLGLGIIAISGLLLGSRFPQLGQKSESSGGDLNAFRTLLTWPIFLGFFSYLVFSAYMMGPWAYLERIGTIVGLSAPGVGTALAITCLWMSIGPLIAAWASSRSGRLFCIGVGLSASIVGIFWLMGSPSMILFVISVSLYTTGNAFAMPFYQGLFASVDPLGRVAVLGNMILYLGMAFGPVVSGMLIINDDYNLLIWVSTICAILCFPLVVPACLRMRLKKTEI